LKKFHRVGLIALIFVVGYSAGSGETVFERIKSAEEAPFKIIGTGFVTDDSHPRNPDDFRKYNVTLLVTINPELGEQILQFELDNQGKVETAKYFIRRGRIFQIDDNGAEKQAETFGDLSVATVAAIHPEIVADAILERRENVEPDHADGYLFAWNDELWSVLLNDKSGRILSLQRRTHHDVFGDGSEQIYYDKNSSDGKVLHPDKVTVSRGGRELAQLKFGAPERGVEFVMPNGDISRDHTRLISADDISFKELAPSVFSIDLETINTRVFVAEFMDFLVVIEGAYNSRNCDLLAEKIRERFQKPVKFFTFSHLHGQYIGGIRSWVSVEATIIVPSTTLRLAENIVNNPNYLHPDALTLNPKPLQITVAKEGRRIDDATNALEIYNVDTDHTDEYFIFYFPRQKVLLTGDLLFYTPGQPLKGRSIKLCDTVQKLRLDVDTYVCTWPLSGYDTKNIVTKSEMQEACSPRN